MEVWFKNQSIQKKLIFSNLLGNAIAYLLVFWIILGYEYFALRQESLAQIQVKSSIVAENIAAAAAFYDVDAANESLELLRGSHEVIEVHLLLNDKRLLTSYYRDATHKTPMAELKSVPLDSQNVSLSHIVLHKRIFLRSEPVGSLLVVSSLEYFYNRLIWYAFIIFATTIFGLYLSTVIALKTSKIITRPLISLTRFTQKVIREGYANPASINSSNDEIGHLSRAFTTMISQINERDKILQRMAYYDKVTGIANRHYFEERIKQTLEEVSQNQLSCYLLLIDLDDFKIINDQYGHPVGDMVLRYVGSALKSVLRESDAIFRIGGDEFAIIVESNCSVKSIDAIAMKIIAAISKPVVFESHELRVGASIGVSCFPNCAIDIETLISSADHALYASKKRGKNQYTLCTEHH